MRLATLALSVGLGTLCLAACGSSNGGVSATVPTPTTTPAVTAPPAAPATTEATVAPTTIAVTATTAAPATTEAPAPAATEPQSNTITVTDADVADLEKQLDDIDQLLAGVDSDLSQD
jgi:hypothetical protein